MSHAIGVRRIGPDEAAACVDALSDVLIDCVEGGASVNFMAPLARDKARAFWREAAEGVARGERTLFVAEDADGRIVGTVQMITRQPENQPHRADVAKMLVHRDARRRGVAQRLLAALDDAARAAGKTVLVLDTVTGGDAERLYARGMAARRCRARLRADARRRAVRDDVLLQADLNGRARFPGIAGVAAVSPRPPCAARATSRQSAASRAARPPPHARPRSAIFRLPRTAVVP